MFIFQIRIIINQANFKQIDVKADLHALRLASLNQILDPWIYILFRKELFLRTFQVLKSYLSVLCSCFCFRRGLFQRTHNNNFQNSSNCNKAVEISENGHVVDREANSSNGMVTRDPTDSYAADDMEDQLPLKPETHHSHEMLDLRHSACLFCLGNHPKRVVLSSLAESRSVEELQHSCGKKRTSAFIENRNPNASQTHIENQRSASVEDTEHSGIVCSEEKSALLLKPPHFNNKKRNSIHLSLENLKGEGSCSCLHHTHTEEQATRRG